MDQAVGNVYASDMFIAGKALRDIFYPVGSIFQSTDETSQATFIGGTWERFGNGRTLVGVDESDSATLMKSANNEGGSTTPLTSHAHSFSGTTALAPIIEGVTSNADVKFQGAASGNGIKTKTHNHTYSGTTTTVGNNVNHNNMPPYYTAFIWRRTA